MWITRSKEVLFSMIDGYTEDIELYAAVLLNNVADEKRKKEILSEMEETAGKLMLACRDLKKELGQHGKTD